MTDAMTNAALIVETATIRPGREGPATGEIWLELGGSPFPMKGWNDFVVVIVDAWLRAALDLFAGAADAKVHFMDGPFVVEMHAEAEGTWLVRLNESGVHTRMIRQASVHPVLFAKTLIDAAQQVVAACREQKTLWSTDAESLERLSTLLRSVMARRDD